MNKQLREVVQNPEDRPAVIKVGICPIGGQDHTRPMPESFRKEATRISARRGGIVLFNFSCRTAGGSFKGLIRDHEFIPVDDPPQKRNEGK